MGKRYTQEEIVQRIEAVHPNKYTFDNFKFTRLADKSILTCKIHGDFLISPHKSISGRDCRKCSDKVKGDIYRRTLKDFIRDARLKHGNHYKYRGFTEIINNNTPIKMFCRKCNRVVEQRINEHLQGKHHWGCVSLVYKPRKPREKIKRKSQKILSDLQRENKKMSKEWQYTPDWSEEEMMNGSYCGFVYLFQFVDGSTYIGSKQIYKRVKDYKKIKPDSLENGWREYSSSSKIVNQKIADGEDYTKTILWCFADMKETLLIETALIINEGLKVGNLNLSIMHKARLPTGADKKRLFGVLRELLSYLN